MACAILASAMSAATAISGLGYAESVAKPKELNEVVERVRAHVRRIIREQHKGVAYRLARAAGVDGTTIYNLLDSRRGIGVDVLAKICTGTREHADTLMFGFVDKRFYVEGSELGPGGKRPGRRPRLLEEAPAALSEQTPAAKRGPGR